VSPHSRPLRSFTALLAAITSAALPACGSRTSLDLVPPTPTSIATLGSGRTDASPHRASDSGPFDAPGNPTPDPGPRDASNSPTPDSGLPSPDATAACPGGPWVVFSLYNDALDGGPPSYQVYARHPGGSGGHEVVLPHPNVTFPSVSPDGSSIVYQSPTDGTLYVYGFGAPSDVAIATGITSTTGFWLTGASISPDGTLVAFTRDDGIAVVPANGTGTPQNVPGGSVGVNSYEALPVFTGDSQSIAFATDVSVESLRIDNGNLEVLVDTEGDAAFVMSNPVFSPDYESLAVIVVCETGQYAPVTLRTYAVASLPAPCTSGSIVTGVADSLGQTAWGPTGMIAFASGEDVLLVSATGGTPTNLTSDLTGNGVYASEPTWAPACTKL
jgi:Tol biopolymer transport system component